MALPAALAQAPAVCLESVDSTNSEARRRIGADGEAIWVSAGCQTSGRGRRARPWISEPGNLYASLAFRPEHPPGRLGEYAFVAALALHDAVAELCPSAQRRIALKWPNDLICARGKLAGILLEGDSAGTSEPPLLVIGWGVNCAHHPDSEGYPATDLEALGCTLAPEVLFAALRESFAGWAALLQGEGMTAIRREWLNRAQGVGDVIDVRLDGSTISGVFRDLDSDGRLVLALADGSVKKIASGEVFWPATVGEGRNG